MNLSFVENCTLFQRYIVLEKRMDGDPMYKTDEALSTLTDFVTDVMIQLCDGADNEQAQSFSNDTG